MAEQRLDHPNVDAVLEKVVGEAVAQRVRADPLGDVGRVRRSLSMAATFKIETSATRRPEP